MNLDILSDRRKKLREHLKNDELVVIFASSLPAYPHNFLQSNNFMYFTGLNVENAIFVYQKRKKKSLEVVFIERNNPKMEVWLGKKMSQNEAKKISGIKQISYIDEFEQMVSNWLNSSKKCMINLNSSGLNGSINHQQQFASKIKQHFPQIKIEDVSSRMIPLRSIKSDWEVAQIQKAIDVTAKAIDEIYSKAKPGMMEYELEAILKYEITRNGLRHIGFNPIIASGVNAATLHYDKNNAKIGKNELLLMDIGAACNNYSADISRTFPVSGKFTKRQKEVYSEVLKINKKMIELVKPGISLETLNKKTVELMQESLIKLGLIKEKGQYKKYYMHSVGHHLGMDTHDIGSKESVLEVGSVITIEPGIYIPEEKIGVRIEDDILVVKDGYKVLSKDIPKEINDLES